MPELNGHPVTDRELAIIQVASIVVADWLRDPNRKSFRGSILSQSIPLLGRIGPDADDYPAFRRVANAIRTGQGHVSANPGPLIAAVRGELGILIWRPPPLFSASLWAT